MTDITDEMKAKLLAVKSADEAVELIRATGQEVTTEDAARLWDEIEHARESGVRELSKDELEAVGGGISWDPPSGCHMMFLASAMTNNADGTRAYDDPRKGHTNKKDDPKDV